MCDAALSKARVAITKMARGFRKSVESTAKSVETKTTSPGANSCHIQGRKHRLMLPLFFGWVVFLMLYGVAKLSPRPFSTDIASLVALLFGWVLFGYNVYVLFSIR